MATTPPGETAAPETAGPEALLTPAEGVDDHQLMSASDYQDALARAGELAGTVEGEGTEADGTPEDAIAGLSDPDLAAWAKDRGIDSPEKAIQMARDSQRFRGERSEEISELRERLAAAEARLETTAAPNGAEPGRDQLLDADLSSLFEQGVADINAKAIEGVDQSDPNAVSIALGKALAETQKLTQQVIGAQREQFDLRLNQHLDDVRSSEIEPVRRTQFKQDVERKIAAQDGIYGPETATALREHAMTTMQAWQRSNPELLRSPDVVDMAFAQAFASQSLNERNRAAATSLGSGGSSEPKVVDEGEQALNDIFSVFNGGQMGGGL